MSEITYKSGEVAVVVTTPKAWRKAVESAENLGLEMVSFEAAGEYGWDLHEDTNFDAFHPKPWSELDVELGRTWFHVTSEGSTFKVKCDDREDWFDCGFRLKFE